MGFFDRFRRNSVRKYEFQDSPFVDRSGVTPVTNDYVRTRRRPADSWLWLLLLPLFLLLGLGAYSYLTDSSPNGFRSNQPNFISNIFERDNQQNTSDGNDTGIQFGVGGAPVTATPTPSSTPIQNVKSLTVESDEGQESGRVQSASERQIPSVGPSTGRAE